MDFADVNKAWAGVQAVIYTQTLSAGVDFSVATEHTFDSFIHVYGGMSCTAD